MKSSLTVLLQATQCNSLPQSTSKQMSFGTCNEKCAEERGPLQKEYDIDEWEIEAMKDKKLEDLIALLEANNRAKSSMKTIPGQNPRKFRLGEDTDSEEDDTTDSDDGENDEVMDVVAQRKIEELKQIESLSIFLKVWLRRIGLSREKGDASYDSRLRDLERTIGNVQENIKRYKNFTYKEFHEDELRQRNKESLRKALIKVLEEKEKSGFKIIDEDIDLCERPTVRLCALLGLKLDFLDRLETFTEDLSRHRSFCDLITIFLQNNSRSVSLELNTSLKRELLESIGFDPLSTAVETMIARSSKENMQCHIDACEWAEIFIRDEFKYNPLLSSRVGEFPFKCDSTNSWFQLPVTNCEEAESTRDPCDVKIMNFVANTSHASKDIHSQLDGSLSQSDGVTVLYHGTDYKSAVAILFRGIYLRAGRHKRDFSCGSGFYLTKNLDEAVNWALATTAKPAILVFQVEKKDLDSAKRLNLTNYEERWCKIVTSFRSGRRTAATKEIESTYDLIEGPQATMIYDEESRELYWKQKPSSYQICLISDDFAEIFEKSLHSILFLEVS